MTHPMIDMNALVAAKRAERASKGLIADNDVACATREELAYENAKHAARQSGKRDAATTARLLTLRAARDAAHGKA